MDTLYENNLPSFEIFLFGDLESLCPVEFEYKNFFNYGHLESKFPGFLGCFYWVFNIKEFYATKLKLEQSIS